ncbi:MAG: CHC2 zinc finger domain-containing protein [Bacteroidota bacterium]
MNANQAKQIQMIHLMERLGFDVKKVERGGTEHKYLSPFRTEKEPSFNVNLTKNSWYDFGEAEGGNTLDFAIKYLRSNGRASRVPDALSWLETKMGRSKFSGRAGEKNINQKNLFSFSQQSPPQAAKKNLPKLEVDRDLEFVKVSPLQSPLIFSYLEGRRIPRELAKKYLVLIHYRNKNKPSQKPYFAFGMQNRSGGYEIRSASDDPKLVFKSALIARDITIVSGKKGREAVNIFEGKLDFLSLLVILQTDQLAGDALILNGLQSYGFAKAYIKEQDYKTINTFLDNNGPGQNTTQDFANDFPGLVFNQSPIFLPHVDLNDALKAGFMPTFSPVPNPPQP